jgi:hypothetical protein
LTQYIGDGPNGATFSEDRSHRWSLWRRWEAGCSLGRMLPFIGLNPSTADESLDDPTVRRCISFAHAWNYGGMVMLNIFAFRATDPKDMKSAAHPIGPSNDHALLEVSKACGRVICCWGTHGAYMNRGEEVVHLLGKKDIPFFHLGLTKDGHPKHPLYLLASTQPALWRPGDAL